MRTVALLGLALLLLGAGSRAAGAAPIAWVEYAQSGPEIRVATSAPACPTPVIDGRASPMQTRSTATPAFPLTVCRLAVPRGAKRASIDGAPLPLPRPSPRRILIFGDTGCRVQDGQAQACNDPRAWPFAAVVRKAAARRPDLVIHVGDYYYRESPCPTGKDGCAGTSWRADFFDPAGPLLATAPWVFVRGNHEACTRGGDGWLRLLDSASQPLACPAASPPFAVDLGDLHLYVLDSSGASDTNPSPSAVAAFSRQLDALKPLLATKPGWILTHRPIWGLTPIARLGPIGPLEAQLNKTEQAAVRGRDLSAVQMIVSGHIHHFASLSFGKARPAQLIAGTGGDVGEWADTPVVRDTTPTVDGLTARRLSFERYGYFLLDRAGADWVGVFRDLDDRVIANCRLHGRNLVCWAAGKGR